MFLSSSSSVNPLECVSMNNQKCKARPEIVNIGSNDPTFYPFSIKVNKCIGNCNNISEPYAKICTPDIVKNLNLKVFNLMTLTNETRHIEWHKSCRCICRLDKIICNKKQRWNKDKCRCECKELIDKGVCDKGYFFNPSNCECECDKSCNIGEYLDYLNCECRKKLIDPLVEKCTENIVEINLLKKTFDKNENKDQCISYLVYKVLFLIFFTLELVFILLTTNR